MHAYAVDPHLRERVTIVLFVIGISLAFLLHWILNLFAIALPWWVETPGVLGVYGAIRYAFDRWIWRLEPIPRLTGIPNLHGRWSGQVITSCHDHRTGPSGHLDIYQSWKLMSIRYDGDESVSESEMVVLSKEVPGRFSLAYSYVNRPKAHAVDTMKIHFGTARLGICFSESQPDELIGEYYTDQHRSTYGSLRFTR